MPQTLAVERCNHSIPECNRPPHTTHGRMSWAAGCHVTWDSTATKLWVVS